MENYQIKKLNSVYQKGLAFIDNLKDEQKLTPKSAEILAESFTDMYYNARRHIFLEYFSEEIISMHAIPFFNIYKQLVRISEESVKESFHRPLARTFAYKKF